MLMAKKQTVQKEPDSVYFLKLVIYLIVGAQWLRIENLDSGWSIPVPVGFLIGLCFASHDHFQIDRKIEYALLLISTFIAFWLPIGIFINV